MRKGFTIIELMISLAILGILTSVAIPMVQNYTKLSRVSEVPLTIKGIAQIQIARREDPSMNGLYASDLTTLEWTTSKGTTDGKCYGFGTNGVPDCDPGTAADLMPIGLAEAWSLLPNTVPDDWVTVCLDEDLNMSINY